LRRQYRRGVLWPLIGPFAGALLRIEVDDNRSDASAFGGDGQN
jgi:hypothetical protein